MNPQPLYPIFLDLTGQPVLIIGAGSVALRKVRTLLESAAKITVIAPHFAEPFALLGGGAAIEKIPAPYTPAFITQKPWRLLFAATHDPAINAQVQRDAANANILCCRCDELEHSDFTNAAVARIGPVTLAVSTHGASPALARRIKDAAQNAIDPILAQLAELSFQWRHQVKKQIPEHKRRTALLQKLAGPEIEHTLRTHGPEAAHSLFLRWLAEAPSLAADQSSSHTVEDA